MGFSKGAGGGAVRHTSRGRGVGWNQRSGGRGRDDLEVEVYMLQTGQQCCETVQQHLVHRAPWLQETQSHPYGDGSKVTPPSSYHHHRVCICSDVYSALHNAEPLKFTYLKFRARTNGPDKTSEPKQSSEAFALLISASYRLVKKLSPKLLQKYYSSGLNNKDGPMSQGQYERLKFCCHHDS